MGNLTCDRQSLIMYSEGILLDFRQGRGRMCNEVEVERAFEALEKGETVYLLEAGRIVSSIKEICGCWEECEV